MRSLALVAMLVFGCGDDDGGSAIDAPVGGGPDGTPGQPDGAPGQPDAAPGGGADASTPGGDPSGDGSYAVHSEDVTIASVTATLYGPSTDGGATITVSGAPFALVVVSPGFQMPRAQYDSYARHLATWGFVVVAQDFGGGFSPDHAALAAQTSAVIDWALVAPALAGKVDATRIGAAGHSLGGKISMLAAADDNRIGAVVGWDPVDANAPSVAPERMADIAGPVAVLGETGNGAGGFMPCAPTADNFQQYYAAAAAPALEVTVLDADHMDWVDDTTCGFCGFCTPAGTVDPEAVKALSRRTTVAWFRRHLLGDTAMDAWLTGAAMQADVTAGTVTVQSK